MQQSAPLPLDGRRILVVEDEFILAAELEEVLDQQGATVLGPASSIDAAMVLIEREGPDAAILDLNLNGEISTGLAAALGRHDVPFVILTAYGDSWMTFPEFLDAPVAEKPAKPEEVLRLLDGALARHPR